MNHPQNSRLAIDIREACKAKRTGKGAWTFHVLQELLRRNVPCTLLTDGSPLPFDSMPNSASVLPIPHTGANWHLAAGRQILALPEKHTYLSTTSYIIPALFGRTMRMVPVIHDLIAFQKGKHDKKARFIEKACLKRAINSAYRVCTLSESTKDDLLSKIPRLKEECVQTVYAGPTVKPIERDPDGRTILCPATLCPRKNQLRLIEAFNALPDSLCEQYSLRLIGGRGWNDEEIVKLAEASEGVLWEDFLADEEYAKALQTCEVLALPSLYEGFGMQILDALYLGIPVLTSVRGSIPEVSGNAAKLCDPESVDSISESLCALLSDQDLRQDLREEGPKQARNFSWERTVDAIMKTI